MDFRFLPVGHVLKVSLINLLNFNCLMDISVCLNIVESGTKHNKPNRKQNIIYIDT
jgi:hypothetical protein